MSDPSEISSQKLNCTDAAQTASPYPVLIVIDSVRTSSPDYFGILSGWQHAWVSEKLLRAGLTPSECEFRLLSKLDPTVHSGHKIIITMGEDSLRAFTGKKSIDKWHMSPLLSPSGQKVIPTFSLERQQKQYELGFYIERAFVRAAEQMATLGYERAPERFHLNPGFEETLALLEMISTQDELSCDIETGRGLINTIGFAWSPSDAIAINVLPERLADENFHRLWQAIAGLLENEHIGKIFQNYIYDSTYLSAYGIKTKNITHDTMHAMKFLYPEFDMNLGNVGRLFTERPYWKDDGKVEASEGKRKDWGNVRDWTKHYLYNCRDTVGTFEATGNQRKELTERNLDKPFREYVMSLTKPVREMCAVGVPVSLPVREHLKTTLEKKVTDLTVEFNRAVGYEINPNSPKQVMTYLHAQGVSLPKKYDKATGRYKESTDSSSLKKVRLKHPDLTSLGTLAEIKTLNKALSSYINFEIRADNRLTYGLNITGTETLRFAGFKDAWDRGFNIQTIPSDSDEVSIKQMFVAPEGLTFLSVDLRQAESRFVAYDAADAALIDMLESGADVHTHVGNAILLQMGRDPTVIPKDEFKRTWRQLGKKAGHGLNYYMKPRMFVETVFNELDMVITVKDAEVITAAYYGLFPGIPKWHASIRRELYNKRRLTAPSGWERYFYGRPGDDMYKEGYAWRPQHTIPWVMNHLMRHLCAVRKHENLNFQLLVQTHDSLDMLVPDSAVEHVSRVCFSLNDWHPEINLPGGKLVIPVEVKAGKTMNELREIVP